MIKEFFNNNNIPKVTNGFRLVTDEEFLKQNNITISKVTYSYKFPYEITYKYKCTKRGSFPNEARNKFLQSIYDRLLKLDDCDLIIDRPNFIIELKYKYKNKYYNININSESIIFNNIDYENIGELEILILNMIGYDLLEMGKYEHHNIVYKIDFGSCYINKIINVENMIKIKTKHYTFFSSKKCWINISDLILFQTNFKINLRGRNKWLIHQNTKNRNDGSINDLYKYIKSTIILPDLLNYLFKDNNSLFSCLPLEIINIIIDILKL